LLQPVANKNVIIQKTARSFVDYSKNTRLIKQVASARAPNYLSTRLWIFASRENRLSYYEDSMLL